MKKIEYYIILCCFIFIPGVAQSGPVTTTIIDTGDAAFWGGDVVNGNPTYGDVIGSDFSVETMEITRDGKDWTVVLTGPYFSNYQAGVGITEDYGPGDLYISSSGWTAMPDETIPEHYTEDIFSLSEGWDFVVSPLASTAGYGLFTLDGSYTSTNAPGGYIYREDQAWRGGGVSLVPNSSASYLLSGNTLTFTFNTGDLFWSDQVGFHWTMKCGNDVLEGPVPAGDIPPVPEPSTMVLLGLGLTSLVAYRKIKG
jgi:hypothetical protein